MLRGGQEDLIHSTCFAPGLNLRELRGSNRRGRPRVDWLRKALAEAWETASQLQPEERRQELEGRFLLLYSILPLRRAAQDSFWWNETLARVPTRREENLDQAL